MYLHLNKTKTQFNCHVSSVILHSAPIRVGCLICYPRPTLSVLLMCSEIGKFRRTYLSDLDSGAIYKAGISSPKYPLDSVIGPSCKLHGSFLFYINNSFTMIRVVGKFMILLSDKTATTLSQVWRFSE